MPHEPILIRCENCNTRIIITGDRVVRSPRPTAKRNQGDERDIQSGVHEGLCPKCDTPFEIWSQPTITSTHVIDLEENRPELFTDDARERVEKLGLERKEQEARRQESQKRSEEARRKREEERVAKAEAKQAEVAAAREARLLARSTDDGDEGDWGDDDGGRSSNDDRSDSMNPNNDAYHASRN